MEELLPLTNDLITATLDARDYKYFVDEDGDVGGYWDETLFYFLRIGQEQEVLLARLRAQRTFGTDDIPRLYSFCNGWNDDRLWPKAYVKVGANETVHVYGELATDLEKGVAQAQLDQLIMCAISSGCELAGAVAELTL